MSALHRRVLLQARRNPYMFFRRIRKEVCWMCKGLAVVNVPDRHCELGVAQEPCANCAGRGYIVREA